MKIQNQVINTKQVSHLHIVTETNIFCPECGECLCGFEIINKYVCSYCHWHVSENDKFCWHCGEELKGLADMHYWCNNNELDKLAFTNLAEALKLSKEDVK
jgi:predicted amidophosphoribosyltransferase